jgi:hypothetical protein
LWNQASPSRVYKGTSPGTIANSIDIVGTRFTNPLYAPLSNTSLSSCWGCLVTVAEEVPCILEAIAEGNPALLLDCGVTKDDVRA